MIVRDIWGKIEIEDKYLNIIESLEFGDLKNKTQLGLNCSPNAIHTRFQHSLGVYYLSCKLIEIAKKKFSGILNITKEDEEAVKLMALTHDIGHGCFSHVSEKYLEGTHEERTIKILTDPDSDLHKVIVTNFGESVLERLLECIQIKEKIKNKSEVKETNNLMLIIGKLLSGGIDIDRIDYIFRDSKQVLDEYNDFSSILDCIDLEFIGDSLEIVFDERAEYTIANFFNKRFELYDTIYFSNRTRLLECVFKRFLDAAGIKLDWNTTEIEMNNIFREMSKSSDPIIRRYAKMLSLRNIDDNVKYKEFDSEVRAEFFYSRIMNAVPELRDYQDVILRDSVNISIYNRKNKIYIRKGGLIQDISECSKILNSDLQKEKHLVGVDIAVLRMQLEKDGKTKEEIDSIIKRIEKAMSPEIEQEKKYRFNSLSLSPVEDFKKIKSTLGLGNPKYIVNDDTYYDKDKKLYSMHINLRKRGEGEWTLKRPVEDQTSISKRDEKNFSSLREALEFMAMEWNVAMSVDEIGEEIRLKTKRSKFILECYGGVFEVVFDKTVPEYGQEDFTPFFTIECEFKSGNSSGLYFINQMIKSFDFIEECNLSKREIALGVVKDELEKRGGAMKMTPVNLDSL